MGGDVELGAGGVLSVCLVIVVALLGGMFGCPNYNVWKKGKVGEAQLRQAEQNRQITIEEARAKLEAAKMLSDAEIERARGVMEANKIIAEGLGGPEGYLRYLWIQALMEDSNSIIYIPTEANLPLLEARSKGPAERGN